MSAPADLRRGWCPSVLRPMLSGDGLLLRFSLPGPGLQAALARGIADCARRFGNGLVDLTQRANMQLRGVSEATLPALSAQLASLGLDPAAGEREAARNIMASPLAGLDPSAVCDIRPVVTALRKRLAGDPSLRALPAKFSFLVDDASRLRLDDLHADIRFEADGASGDARFVVGLGGHGDSAVIIGNCTAHDLPDVARALARAFLELRGADDDAPRRMAELVGRVGVEAIAGRAETLVNAPARQEYAPTLSPRGRGCLDEIEAGEGVVPLRIFPLSRPSQMRRPPSPARGEGKLPVGFHLLEEETGFLGIGAPFGRLSADQLDDLADSAERVGAELRLTPWRALLIAAVTAAQAIELRHRLAGSRLILTPGDARLAVAACPGAPACSRATVSTREDALLLAPLARRFAREGIALHLSGCAKGCARADVTPVTLVGRDGRYDLVLDGLAGGQAWRSGLSAEEAKGALAEMLLDSRPGDEARTTRAGSIR